MSQQSHPTTTHSLATAVLHLNMSPSEKNDGQEVGASTTTSTEGTLKTSGTPAASTNGIPHEVKNEEKAKDGITKNPKKDAPEASSKFSGAELKKQKQLEKQARREKEKQAKTQVVLPDLKGPKKVDAPQEPGRKGSAAGIPATPTTKTQHKRTGSTSKSIPLRAVHTQAIPAVVKPQKDNKNVALFGHLYGQPRRTTIAGAGKDVHPAVLALGLQMSNYIICGSNARCVATLLAFKRVTT